ncbi:MAG: radical SAM protein [Infirmifilum sp.]
MSVRRLPTGSVVYGRLPQGCRLCQEGLKTVIFLTGLCPLSCFYCPLSSERKNRDRIFINEFESNERDLARRTVFEVLRSAAKGASLTGGEPLVKMDRALRIIQHLKEVFGEDFHIHLYTSGVLLTQVGLEKLVDAGLDELRIHAPLKILEEKIRLAAEFRDKLSIGLEYPALPGGEATLIEIAELAEKYELSFINLNELEFTETNNSSLLLRGYKMNSDYRSAYGSRGTALKVIRYARAKNLNLTVHFCPVAVKDYQQTGLRYFRTGNMIARPYQFLTDDGTTLEIVYQELTQEAQEKAAIYPRGLLHPLLLDYVKKGRLVERSPLLNWLSIEETPVGQE